MKEEKAEKPIQTTLRVRPSLWRALKLMASQSPRPTTLQQLITEALEDKVAGR